MLTIDRDAATGLIRCMSSGFLTVAEVQQSSAKVREAVAEVRRKFGSFKMLVVAVDSVIQSPEVLQAVQDNKPYVSGPRDRLAVVTASALVKRQGDRTLTDQQERMFDSEPEAMAWLMSEGANGTTEEPGDLRRTLAN